MLDTAFHKYLSAMPKARMNAANKKAIKAWSYIGRFIWGFAMVEYQVNQLFDALINIDYPAGILLTYTLDLRKKLKLIEIILKSRNIDESATYKRVHKLHDLRNVIAHWPFFEEGDKSGLWCDYINKHRDLDFGRPGTKEKNRLIKYSEFDSYDVDASELYEKFDELLNSATPLTDLDNDSRIAIEEAISSSDNVVRFPSKPQSAQPN
jgi:hypothetical protein